MKKKVFIYAYTQLNLGDDLFIKVLCERYPDVKFYIMCYKNASKGIKNIPNLVVIPRIPLVDGFFRKINLSFSLNNIIQKWFSLNCDAIINIGGSIFIQNDKWQITAKQYQSRLTNNIPFFIIGSNFGPYKDTEYLIKYKKLFQQIDDICFREEHSYNIFSDLPNVRYEADVVFSYVPKSNLKSKKQVVISVIDLTNRKKLKKYEIIYLDYIVQLTRNFIEKGYEIILMAFCQHEGDRKAINKIEEKLKSDDNNKVKSYVYTGNLEESLKVIQESEVVVASRFHAMILGWVFEKSVYPLLYSDKSLHVIEDTGFDGLYTRIDELEKISPVQAGEVVDYLINLNPFDIDAQIKSANRQFLELDKLLLKK